MAPSGKDITSWHRVLGGAHSTAPRAGGPCRVLDASQGECPKGQPSARPGPVRQRNEQVPVHGDRMTGMHFRLSAPWLSRQCAARQGSLMGGKELPRERGNPRDAADRRIVTVIGPDQASTTRTVHGVMGTSMGCKGRICLNGRHSTPRRRSGKPDVSGESSYLAISFGLAVLPVPHAVWRAMAVCRAILPLCRLPMAPSGTCRGVWLPR